MVAASAAATDRALRAWAAATEAAAMAADLRKRSNNLSK